MDKFKKRTFSFLGFIRSLLLNVLYAPRLIIAIIRPSTSAALREQVMLGCTSVNDCRYCDWLHTRLALQNAVDVDELNSFLANPDNTQLPQRVAVAVLYAQHFAEQKTRSDRDAIQRLKSEFTWWERLEIHAYLHAIYFGNLTGNTFDALLSRFRGMGKEDSFILTELLVSIVGAPVLLLVARQARKDKDDRFIDRSATPKVEVTCPL